MVVEVCVVLTLAPVHTVTFRNQLEAMAPKLKAAEIFVSAVDSALSIPPGQQTVSTTEAEGQRSLDHVQPVNLIVNLA